MKMEIKLDVMDVIQMDGKIEKINLKNIRTS